MQCGAFRLDVVMSPSIVSVNANVYASREEEK